MDQSKVDKIPDEAIAKAPRLAYQKYLDKFELRPISAGGSPQLAVIVWGKCPPTCPNNPGLSLGICM